MAIDPQAVFARDRPPSLVGETGTASFIVTGLAYFLALIWVGSYFGTWSDEEYTLATTAHGIVYGWERALSYELQAPLYFGVLGGWRLIDHDVWFARLFSILCGTALFFALNEIGARVAPRKDPYPFAILVAINPFVLVAALQIRLYALALLLSALLWLCYDAGFASGSSRKARIGFLVVAITGVYVQYFLGFMLIGFGCALLIRGSWKVLGTYVAYASVVAIAALPLVSVARSQAGGYTPVGISHFDLFYLTGLHPWLEFLIPHFYSLMGESRPEHVLYFVVAVVLGISCVWSAPNLTRRLASTIGVAAAIQVVYVIVAVAVDQRLNDRYFIALFVPVAVAAYSFISSSTAMPPVPQRVFVGAITLMTLAAVFSQYRFLAQNGDWIRVAAYLEDRAKPGDLIAIYTSDNFPAFMRQYHGNVRVVPFPRANPSDRYVITAVDVNSAREAEEAFAKLRPFRTLWLVDSVRCVDYPPRYGCVDLHDAVDADFHTIDRQLFYTNSVSELTWRDGLAAAPK